MAEAVPQAMPAAIHRGYALAAAVVSTVAWAYLAWPDLATTFTDPLTHRALGYGAAALAAALGLRPVTRAFRHVLGAGPAWIFPLGASVVSVALAAWLFFGPMNGQLIARDSCLYVLEGRALAHLQFGVPVSPPRLATSAHFLFVGVDGRLHGVFAPGYPLFLAPFTLLGIPWFAGTLTAVFLTLGQVILARSLDRDPWVLRVSLLLALPSFARAIETADLLSHAFVATLCALGFSLALRLPDRPSLARAIALGASVGWVFSARMLDGFILAATLAAVLLAPTLRRRIPLRVLAVAVLSALPFVILVAAQQKVATGSYRTPVAVAYVHHADYPPTCLHLGFGRDVGCVVEHSSERAAFGDDGYTPREALRIIRQRTSVLGPDLFGLGAIALLAFVGLALAPDAGVLFAAAFPLVFTLTYGLFYYGNAPIFGARHLFPVAPFLWVLVARALTRIPHRASGWFDRQHIQGAALIFIATLSSVAFSHRWSTGLALTRRLQGPRQNLRALISRDHLDHAIVLATDIHSYLSAIDPWADGDHRVVSLDDRAGNLDLRRFYPTLPVWESIGSNRLLQIHTPTPGPGIRVELERSWPTYIVPHDLGAATVYTLNCCRMASSGDHVLYLFQARPGSSVDIPFDVGLAGHYRMHLNGMAWVDYGIWSLAIDGVPLPVWDGYAPRRILVQGEAAPPQYLSAGPHTFTARVIGRNPRSLGYLAAFDSLVGEWVP